MNKTIIHLELAAEVLRPVVKAEVIREKDNLSPFEFFHHPFREIIADTYRQPGYFRISQRTKQCSLFFLNDSNPPAKIQVLTKEDIRINIVVESVP